jgi:hypothetical protein
MPPNTVKVDRSTRWGNPLHVGDEGVSDAAAAVRLFGMLLDDHRIADTDDVFVFTRDRLRLDLAGKNLGCWCPIGTPCHADVLLRIANDTSGEPK